MAAMPEHLSQRPPFEIVPDALSALQLCGAMFVRAELSSPWALESPESEALARALVPDARRVILLHYGERS